MPFQYKLSTVNDACFVVLHQQLVENHQGDDMLMDIENEILKGHYHVYIDAAGLVFFNHAAIEVFAEVLNMARIQGGDCTITGIQPSMASKENYEHMITLFSNGVGV